jgi:hypothetical protein
MVSAVLRVQERCNSKPALPPHLADGALILSATIKVRMHRIR